MKRVLILFSAVILWSCGGNGSGHGAFDGVDTLYRNSYATRFQLFGYGDKGSCILEIKNPWQGADSVRKYVFLSRDGEQPPKGLDAEVVPVPVKNAVCLSSSYIAFIDALGSGDVITGVSGAGFVSTPSVIKRINEGKIADVGNESGVNFELILSIKPDVVFLYGVSGEDTAVTDKLRELGLMVVYIGEYLEDSPLGRAEWIIPFGEFLGKREQAEKIFSGIGAEYNHAMSLVKGKGGRAPVVMLNSPWRDSWFVPGDRSYMVKLLADAGGEYACRGTDSDQSRPISVEMAFMKAAESDIWLNPGSAASIADVVAMNPKFTQIPAVKNGRVFNNNKRMTPGGGSDFWESGTINPHVILQDLVKIIHPELLLEHELYYFQHLE